MGTDFSISIEGDSEEVANTLAHLAIEKISSYESRFSRFLPLSELSVLNREKDKIVSDTFFTVTTEAYKLFSSTHGVFNPLVQIERLGYTDDYNSLSDSEPIANEEEHSIDFSDADVYACGQEKACNSLVEKIKAQNPTNCNYFIEAFH